MRQALCQDLVKPDGLGTLSGCAWLALLLLLLVIVLAAPGFLHPRLGLWGPRLAPAGMSGTLPCKRCLLPGPGQRENSCKRLGGFPGGEAGDREGGVRERESLMSSEGSCFRETLSAATEHPGDLTKYWLTFRHPCYTKLIRQPYEAGYSHLTEGKAEALRA